MHIITDLFPLFEHFIGVTWTNNFYAQLTVKIHKKKPHFLSLFIVLTALQSLNTHLYD